MENHRGLKEKEYLAIIYPDENSDASGISYDADWADYQQEQYFIIFFLSFCLSAAIGNIFRYYHIRHDTDVCVCGEAGQL